MDILLETTDFGKTSKGVFQMGSETQPEVLDLGKGQVSSFSQSALTGRLQPQGHLKFLDGSKELQLCSRSQGILCEAILRM